MKKTIMYITHGLLMLIPSLSFSLELVSGVVQELEIPGPAIVSDPIASDYDNDGVSDLFFRGEYFYDADHGLNMKHTVNYHLLYGGHETPLSDDAKVYIGLSKLRYTNGDYQDYGAATKVEADFNADGYIDIFGGNDESIYNNGNNPAGTCPKDSNTLALHLGGKGGFTLAECVLIVDESEVAESTFSNALFMKTADVNQDGLTDIIMHRIGTEWHDPYELYSYDLQILVNNGNGGFNSQIIDIDLEAECRQEPKFGGGTRIQCYFIDLDNPVVVDYDQDGDIDVVFQREFASRADGSLYVFVNDEGSYNSIPVIIPIAYETVVINESQSFQRLDYPDWYDATIAIEPTDPQIAVIRSLYLTDPSSKSIEVDYYNDGFSDFIVVDGGQLKIFNGQESGFDFNFESFTTSAGELLSVGDFDGNGSMDLILINAVPEYIGNSSITPLYNMDPEQITNPGNSTPPPVDAPPPTVEKNPPPAGTEVEMEGAITAVGVGFIEVDGVTVIYTDSTEIKFNDVSGFAAGLPVQLKGIQDVDGVVHVSSIEVG